ncbi:MAG: InlB B-repeat-containing protein, partial [Eubacteriales bacterium]|nr:InlB B-repeat-containing protein [Eubacteriales bacterium]
RETEPTSEIVSEHETEPASEIETETESDLEDDAKIKEAESGEEKEKYLVSYLNEDGVVETSRTCKAGEDVDLSVHLGGGEKQLGWSLSEGGEVLGSLKMPENDLELYPVLDKTEASYEINFWQENLSGGYEKVSSRSVTAKAGDMVSAAEVQASKYAKQFAGFTYDGAASSASETVAADGSTVVDVRFKRNTYTISFDLNGNYRSVSDLYYASLSMNVGGATYTGSSYSFTARYGEDISDRWPTAENIVNNPYLSRRYSDYFGGWNGPDGVTRTGAGALNDSLVGGSGDGGTITFSANWVNAGSSAEIPNATIQYHIYQQNVENDDYTLVDTISKTAPASQLTKIALDGYAGYEYDHNTPVGNKTTLKYGPWYAETKVEYYPEQNLYFNRNSYQLTFQIDDETVRSESVKYQAPLAEYSSYEPEDKPAGRAWLDGWYDAEGTLYTFDSMPAEDVVLTASWKYDQLQSLSLTYDLNGADGSIAGKKTAKEVDLRLADASEYAMTGYHFAGWNTKADGSGETYAGRSMFKLAEDTTLYAVWKVNSYTVTWVNEDGTVLETDFEVPYGEMPSYDSAAPVKDGDADMVYTFRGWQPGLTSVTEDVTYTAVFDAVPAETEEPVTEAPKEEPV